MLGLARAAVGPERGGEREEPGVLGEPAPLAPPAPLEGAVDRPHPVAEGEAAAEGRGGLRGVAAACGRERQRRAPEAEAERQVTRPGGVADPLPAHPEFPAVARTGAAVPL